MSTLTYVTLTTSTSVTKRFRIIQGSLKPNFQKTQNRKRTASGRSDNTEGAIIRGWTMTAKLRGDASGADPDGSAYAVRADLETWYQYNNPYGTPTNRFTYTDHLGATFTVEFVGQMDQDNITPLLDGDNSWYMMPLVLEKVN